MKLAQNAPISFTALQNFLCRSKHRIQ